MSSWINQSDDDEDGCAEISENTKKSNPSTKFEFPMDFKFTTGFMYPTSSSLNRPTAPTSRTSSTTSSTFHVPMKTTMVTTTTTTSQPVLTTTTTSQPVLTTATTTQPITTTTTTQLITTTNTTQLITATNTTQLITTTTSQPITTTSQPVLTTTQPITTTTRPRLAEFYTTDASISTSAQSSVDETSCSDADTENSEDEYEEDEDSDSDISEACDDDNEDPTMSSEHVISPGSLHDFAALLSSDDVLRNLVQSVEYMQSRKERALVQTELTSINLCKEEQHAFRVYANMKIQREYSNIVSRVSKAMGTLANIRLAADALVTIPQELKRDEYQNHEKHSKNKQWYSRFSRFGLSFLNHVIVPPICVCIVLRCLE